MKLSKYIDHTLLKADSVEEQFKKLCEEAVDYDFKSVCVNPSNIVRCKRFIAEYAAEKGVESDVLICTVIGFPLGAMTTEAKVFEAKDAIEKGADEVDMVLNIARLKENDTEYVYNEIKAVKEACGDHILKVIIETCLLTDEEKVRACDIIMHA